MRRWIFWLALSGLSWGQTLELGGQVEKPHTYSLSELKQWGEAVKTDRHTYTGVPLRELLKQAGVPDQHDLKGKWMAAYLVAQGKDGYRAVFSLAELDPLFGDNGVWVAFQEDDQELPALRLVVPREKRNARWVRDLQSLKLEVVR
ncbi:MAG: molybdopterin-dependent oxidoreductase [Candidatus Eremiobacteraeota bacterium]|nr:molybdopterin-dependent oxidoreductase [Candidatus Eremiobacteraeota bacterium]MCW5868923.1 molybdopterin-dependent oxidoreductase [Candidatus Eremiobacteraeota bacterium]